MVMSVLAGEAAAKKVVQQQVVQRLAGHWGAQVLKNFPRAAIVAINKVLGPRFVTLTGSKVGVLVLGKQVPFMIGSAIGATGNVVFGLFVIKSADKILGPLPEAWEDAKPAKKTSAAKPRKAVTAKKTAATKAPAKKAISSKSPAKKAN